MNGLPESKIEEGEQVIALAGEVGADATRLMGSLALLMEALKTGEDSPLTIGQMHELENLSNGLTPEESSAERSDEEHTMSVDEALRDRHAIMDSFNAATMPQTVNKAIETGALAVEPGKEEPAAKVKPKTVQILEMVAKGYSPKLIQKELDVHRNTVTNRLNRAKELLGARDLNHAIRRAYETGVLARTEEQLENLFLIRVGAGLILNGIQKDIGKMAAYSPRAQSDGEKGEAIELRRP